MATSSDTFRAATVVVGRALHRLQLQVGRLSEGKESLGHITPLNEAAAVDRGANFLSECLVYSIAAATVAYEYNTQQAPPRPPPQTAGLPLSPLSRADRQAKKGREGRGSRGGETRRGGAAPRDAVRGDARDANEAHFARGAGVAHGAAREGGRRAQLAAVEARREHAARAATGSEVRLFHA